MGMRLGLYTVTAHDGMMTAAARGEKRHSLYTTCLLRVDMLIATYFLDVNDLITQ